MVETIGSQNTMAKQKAHDLVFGTLQAPPGMSSYTMKKKNSHVTHQPQYHKITEEEESCPQTGYRDHKFLSEDQNHPQILPPINQDSTFKQSFNQQSEMSEAQQD